MDKNFIRNSFRLFLTATLFCLFSCKNDDKNSRKEESAIPRDSNTAQVASTATTQPAFIGGKLDTLFVERKTFENVPNGKLVFSFTFTASGQLTLHGWHAINSGGTRFNPKPSLELENGSTSSLSYGPGTYFGNVVLQQNQRVAIEKKLAGLNANYVVFVPQQIESNNIGYKIYVSSTKPLMAMGVMALDPTGEDANPSPPKSYN